jgi:hypothetical protein
MKEAGRGKSHAIVPLKAQAFVDAEVYPQPGNA